MPDMRELLKKRAAATEEAADSYEAKHAKSMAALNRQLEPQIHALRVKGPAEPQMTELHRSFIKGHTSADMIIGRCLFCDPEPKQFKCPACDHETPERWKMTIHNLLNPEWCRERAAKKVNRWAQRG